jgi:hypothetical protein
MEKLIELLKEAINYETNKDLSGEWTEEYRTGFVDGLKRALELIK